MLYKIKVNPRHAERVGQHCERCRRQIQRASVGAAVKICRRSKAKQILGTARGVAKQLQVLLPLPQTVRKSFVLKGLRTFLCF